MQSPNVYVKTCLRLLLVEQRLSAQVPVASRITGMQHMCARALLNAVLLLC
jgi:hypothetical protein